MPGVGSIVLSTEQKDARKNCWGNYEGPHHCDVPLADIIDIAFKANVSGISFEAANPRHAHEYTLFDDVKVPDDVVLIPGVLESK